MLGVAYEAPSLATGYGAYLAQVSSELRGGQRGREQAVGASGCVLAFFYLITLT